ncbi:MAG: hypothetical protein KA250_04960, partial [Verrucomicrobiales bacterium]|nr:hypothetical protein [Verrucomicrobiales bacterium]
MQRRDWLKGTSVAGLALISSRWAITASAAEEISTRFPALAGAVLARATKLGASFADVHFMQTDRESLFVREKMVQGVDAGSSLGCSVRVLVEGAWGFAASSEITEKRLLELVESAVAIANGQKGWRAKPVEIESLPSFVGKWELPVQVDPFSVSLEEKVERLLGINHAALEKGASYCNSQVSSVRERKWLANTFGTRIEQSRIRIQPAFSVTLVDPKKGEFASRASSRPPRAAGYEHLSEWDAAGEAALAVEQAREKMAAPSVVAGKKDLVIA